MYLATRSRARRRAGLDLARAHRDDEVGDRRVLGLARAVADTTAVQPARRASSIASIVSVSVPIWLSLIRTAFAASSSIAALDPLGVRHEQVVADQLDPVAEPRASARAQPAQSSSARPSSSETIG